MHVMMTKEQFDDLKRKAGKGSDQSTKQASSQQGGKKDGDSSPKTELKLKEDDDTHGTIDFEDATVNYFYNASEGRLNFGPSKRKTLAAYCASDSIIATFIMDVLSAMPSAKKPEAKKEGESGEAGEKKDQSQNQYGTANEQSQPSQ